MGLDGLLLNGLQLSERETSSDPIFSIPQKGEKSTAKISLPEPGEPKIGSFGDKFWQIAERTNCNEKGACKRIIGNFPNLAGTERL